MGGVFGLFFAFFACCFGDDAVLDLALADFAADNVRIADVEDILFGMNAILERSVRIKGDVLGALKESNGFVEFLGGVRFLVFGDAIGDLTVDATKIFLGSFVNNPVFKEVLLFFEGDAGIVAINLHPLSFAFVVGDFAETVETGGIDVAIEGDSLVFEVVIEVVFADAVDGVKHINIIFNDRSVILEDFTGFSGFPDTFERGNVELGHVGDVTVVNLGLEHGSKGSIVFGVTKLAEGSRNRTVVFAEVAGLFAGSVLGSKFVELVFAVRGADLESVAFVDAVADGDVVSEHFLHVAIIVFIDTLHDVTVVVDDIHVANLFIVRTFSLIKFMVGSGVNFVAAVIDVDKFVPATVGFAGEKFELIVFDGFAIGANFEAVIVDFVLVEGHGTEIFFAEVEFVDHNGGFSAAATFDFDALFDDLAHNGGFADVTRTTSGVANEAIVFIGGAETIFSGVDVGI